MTNVYTIGHSNRPAALLLDALHEQSIALLLDVRRYPRSRRNPQFNLESLGTALEDIGIEYGHVEALGGRRDALPDSPNTAIREPGFRGYADYMATEAFDRELTKLMETAATRRVAIMCAESNPAQCHRSMVADALVSRGVEVQHIVGQTLRPHVMSPTARLVDGCVQYPALL